MSITGGSVLGPLTNKVSATHEINKALWRYLGLVVLFNVGAPFYVIYKWKANKDKTKEELSEKKTLY